MGTNSAKHKKGHVLGVCPSLLQVLPELQSSCSPWYPLGPNQTLQKIFGKCHLVHPILQVLTCNRRTVFLKQGDYEEKTVVNWEGSRRGWPQPFIVRGLRVKVRGNGNIRVRLGLRMWDLHSCQE